MVCWTDGGWNRHRGIGYASVLLEGAAEPVIIPVFTTQAASSGCEARALALAIALTPDRSDVEIRCDSSSLVDQVLGNASCSVLELIPYVRWLSRNIGSRSLVWVPRDQNQAHVALGDIFAVDDHWHDYELAALRERKQQG